MTEREAMEIIMQVAYDGEFPLNSNEAFGIACKALEKQIPKKPVSRLIKGTLLQCKVHDCPICGEQFGIITDVNYCEVCGQKIDWSEVM